MASRYYWKVVALVAFVSQTAAQGGSVIPQDLQAGFGSDEVQVSYTNQAINGFKDGTTFEKDAVAKEPTFALGDSNGISPTTLYTIIMVDTTCTNARKLHYARANFKNNFDITNIATDTPPAVDYVAPGSVGETGDNRQYTFLMFTNPGRRQITDLKVPGENEAFDIKKFQDDNGFRDAMAGVGMVVKLGGEANCEGGDANPLPDNLPSAAPASSAAGSATSAAASPTGTPSAGTPSSNASRAPVASASPSSTPGGSGGQNNSSSGSRPSPSGAPASSGVSSPVALPSQAPAPSSIATVPVSNVGGEAGTSASSTASPAEQTANAAAGSFGSQNLGVTLLAMALGFFVR
ncbi:hypothetical protein COCVIDRAFT_112910 [Bipolaris victoriae FI3]|uniref:Glycoside hydrolase family 16 protein n=1 Tax=Bipolaris victoriae (strain FI3) TaxID=930091 RepID=W7E3Z7_BIPV3|nr:hypothetical protein COCVIDRAFT_112910 [Bipolaris victoriae FI3]